jgi:hypothetical protein
MSAAAMRIRAAAASVRAAGMSWPWRIVVALATLAAGALLALVVAYWGWRWLGPSPPPPVATAPGGPSAEAIIAAAPFGRAGPGTGPAAPAGASAPAGSALPADARLLGVFAGSDGDGYALLRLPDRGAVLVKSGQDIASGVKLDAVRADGIRISERGTSRDIPLRPGTGPAPVPALRATGPRPTTGVAAPAPTQRAACAAPAGFSGSVYRLNAELLSGMAAQPQSWAALLAPSAGALVVRDDTGLAAMLGMKAGDRVMQANGIALTAIDDVLTGVVKPLAESRPVRLSGMRDGKSREWLFLNAGACPG